MRPHAGGIDFPALGVCRLELNGYAIEPIDDDGRLVGMRPLHPELVVGQAQGSTASDRRRAGRLPTACADRSG
jgi:hypothetical protein